MALGVWAPALNKQNMEIGAWSPRTEEVDTVGGDLQGCHW